MGNAEDALTENSVHEKDLWGCDEPLELVESLDALFDFGPQRARLGGCVVGRQAESGIDVPGQRALEGLNGLLG